MNLNNQHTPEDLAKLFATRKDTHGSHILWISECGEVHLDTLAPELGEDEFEKRTPGMRARCAPTTAARATWARRPPPTRNSSAACTRPCNRNGRQFAASPRSPTSIATADRG